MKKLTMFLAGLLSVSLLFAGCGQAPASTGTDKKTLVIGVDDQFPPMGFRNDANEIDGFDIELAKAVSQEMGVEFKIQPIDWTAKESELKTGNIDLIWNGYTITDDRKEQVLFSEPYLKNNQVVVVDKTKGFTDFKSLTGKKLGVQAASSAMDALTDAADFKDSLKEVVEFKDNTVALMDLKTGGVDAVALDEVVAEYYISSNHEENLVILDEKLSPEEYGVGLRKEDTELCKKLNDALHKMKENGKLAEISTKWFGKDKTIIK